MTRRTAYCFDGFFFFSSRRRHTRCSRDWSSDVCSSDLASNQVQCSAGSLISAPSCTNQTSCTTLYLIRRRYSGRRCREALRFLQSEFVSMGEKTNVRRQKTEAPARAESAARRHEVFGEHAGAADPHLGRIHSST